MTLSNCFSLLIHPCLSRFSTTTTIQRRSAQERRRMSTAFHLCSLKNRQNVIETRRSQRAVAQKSQRSLKTLAS
jgi:hypothetical protein